MKINPFVSALATAILLTGSLLAPRVSADEASAKATGETAASVDTFTAGMQRHGGFFPIYWDAKSGKVYLEIDRFGSDFLMLTALDSGLGSNPIGLDRGQIGESRLCHWRRVGPQVVLHQENWKFRAQGAPEAEQRAVAESFAPSILWAGEITCESDGRVLVDATPLVVSDRHGIRGSLRSSDAGDFSLEKDRSMVAADRLEAFPDNVELHAWLTFTSERPGREVSSVAASGEAMTLGQRISLIRLPEPGYEPRPADPRVGAITTDFADYAAPLDQSIFRSLMVRHRLQLDDEGKVVEPIVYYVDAAAPEPIRSALVEGASWWADAFEKAGFPGGFRVEVAPPDMDPLDLRFNFIQWVHRQTRGWSYGSSVVDPRTGEILKGHVTLGSLRVRQDRLLMDNLLVADARSSDLACAMATPESLMMMPAVMDHEAAIDVALARIRQLSAHEVGHTLGFRHNFAASTYGDRASVMDYPAPRLRVGEQGEIEADDAYGVGVGVWDRFTVQCMYGDLGPADQEQETLNSLIREAAESGWRFISDADARPAGGAHPAAHLWDNGADPVDELMETLKVRQVGLEKFGPNVLLPGQTLGELQQAFAPLYLHHRYQTEAVAKLIGGVDYAYSMPGDPQSTATAVPVPLQQRAVDAMMRTISAETLSIPEDVLTRLVPGSITTAWDREQLDGFTSPVFDPLASVETATHTTVALMIHPARLARLANQHSRVADHPGLALVLEPLKNRSTETLARSGDDRDSASARRIGSVIAYDLINAADDAQTRHDVRAALRRTLRQIAAGLRAQVSDDAADASLAEAVMVADSIERFLERPDLPRATTSPEAAPPGSPIGSK